MSCDLPPERIRAALTAIEAWRQAPEAAIACPVCGATGLSVIDRSARPYSEWYALTCVACGLEHTLHIPLAPPQQ